MISLISRLPFLSKISSQISPQDNFSGFQIWTKELAAQQEFLHTDPWEGMIWKTNIDKNQKPVIGILSQTLEKSMERDPRFKGYKSYMMSAYVKFIESSGAQVVPIVVGESEEEILKKLSKLNGVLFPGGSGDYYELGKFVFDQIKRFNDEGTFYPAWGTCLGYENMVGYTADIGTDAFGSYPISSASLPLIFTANPQKTRMFEGIGDQVWDFTSNNYTYNSHNWGISPTTFKTDTGLNEFWDVTSISLMPNGTAFTASIEAKKYPIFGTQFHPEKPSELWVDGKAINHSWESIKIQRHFADLFVSMSRANGNTFGSFKEVQPWLISNSKVLMTDGQADVYVFP